MERLKQLRKERNLTTTELGLAVGCSNPAISHYEHGDRKPDPDMLVKFADFFEVSVDYLLGRTDKKTTTWIPKERVLVVDKQPLEWTEEDKALGVGSHPTVLSEDEWEWLELRSEVLRLKGKDYLDMLERMIKAAIEIK